MICPSSGGYIVAYDALPSCGIGDAVTVTRTQHPAPFATILQRFKVVRDLAGFWAH